MSDSESVTIQRELIFTVMCLKKKNEVLGIEIIVRYDTASIVIYVKSGS